MRDFTLSIRLANAAMRTPENVAAALRKTADYLDGVGCDLEREELSWSNGAGRIRDENGNTIGEWTVHA